MTKQHFQALAAAMNASKPEKHEGAGYTAQMAQWNRDVQGVATVCSQMNSRFNPTLFYKACGVES